MDELTETRDEIELRDHIFKAQDCEEVLVPVPGWKTKVLLRALTGTKRSEYLAFVRALGQQFPDMPADYFKRLYFEQAKLGVVHPRTKKPVFKDADRDTLMDEHNGEIITHLAAMVRTLSHLDVNEVEAAKKKLLEIQNASAVTS